jgi:two-component system alkaline phosphatase synthesis response regulator PhoP
MENKQYRLLLVDDETDILEFLSYNLRKEGFKVFAVNNGRDAITMAEEIRPHLILLDVMMPDMDGIETCDDYMTKPIKPKVLVSRVKALLKRVDVVIAKPEPTRQPVKGIFIDKEKFVILKDGKEITLPKKEFELLALLYSRPQKVFSRDEIFSTVWGDNIIVGDRTIDVHIRKLREKIGEDYIKTVKGVGYKFID